MAAYDRKIVYVTFAKYGKLRGIELIEKLPVKPNNPRQIWNITRRLLNNGMLKRKHITSSKAYYWLSDAGMRYAQRLMAEERK